MKCMTSQMRYNLVRWPAESRRRVDESQKLLPISSFMAKEKGRRKAASPPNL